jgi:plasmid stabilization system protein ParE
MSYAVEWSEEAELTYIRCLERIEQKWTEREVFNFIERVETVIGFITENPLLYSGSNAKPEVHQAFISRQTRLYYELYQERVILLGFIENKEDPAKDKFR